MDKITLTDEEWRAKLSAEQYHILRQAGTERAFTGEYDHTFADGTYLCAGCGTALFGSGEKYNSGCGWPAFTAPIADEAIDNYEDTSHGMRRVEVRCSRCDGHLGHVFPDGPGENGLRYCINSGALEFKPG
ncbi:peptide-methionine (R)-S-oxide reductase MsrB [Sphingobium fluviale]|uniref:Peptide methionine sulfoxide reductase MsrB n=1 Tax=Sphingobium fluviale TaxID=2506423 RepID=A0A4V1N370_9SPHN|nr:peptide-methionine (R)-S-oxide reductase MsrB [Sphingobium fluviale]RXR25945.1 peptide-methionine (R)-S-oxide reductase [Sphingobium fluviale]